MSQNLTANPTRSGTKTILLAWIVAGTLDLLAALIVYSLVMKVVPAEKLLQGIAKGILGRSAFDGGTPTAIAGIACHYLIALIFTIFYYLIFPYIPFLSKYKIVSGLLYGIFVWCVMNLAVLPALHIAPIPTKWDSMIRGAVILMFCIGLPIALIIGSNHPRKKMA